jgi:hypothetical protein
VVLSPTPLDGDAVARAAGAVWAAGRDLDPDADAFTLRPLDDGAVLQVLAHDTVVLSVLRPRMLPTLDEVVRLLPDAPRELAGAPCERLDVSWWTDAFTPWTPGGEIGMAILDAAAAASGAVVVHQGLAPAWTQAPRRRSAR